MEDILGKKQPRYASVEEENEDQRNMEKLMEKAKEMKALKEEREQCIGHRFGVIDEQLDDLYIRVKEAEDQQEKQSEDMNFIDDAIRILDGKQERTRLAMAAVFGMQIVLSIAFFCRRLSMAHRVTDKG